MDRNSIPHEWLPQYTYKDYETWEGYWELIYGLPYSMSPSPKREHQALGRKFMRSAEDALANKGAGCDCQIYYELDWVIDDRTIVRPDIMIVCGKFEEDFLHFPPALVLEIASDKTRLKDRNIKFKLYESNGVRFYLIADIDRKTVEVFTLKDNYYVEIHSLSFQLTSSCSIELNLEKLW